ncbi:MAG: methyltransferase domain-containing protein, partial [Actinomycetota bacterium]
MINCCPVCGAAGREDVLSLLGLPVLINAQVDPDDAIDVARGDIDLVVCTACGHMYNRSFDPDLLGYDAAYENTLHYSPRFREYASSLAHRLVEDHALQDATVGELGSGPGHFLTMLCEAGAGAGLGWDPSFDADRLEAPDHGAVSVSAAPFPTDGSTPLALAASQHVLEHLEAPVDAVRALASAVAQSDGVVYSEVPNGALMVRDCALWDLIYEHLSYFVPSSLDLLHRRAGLRLTSSGTTFGDQFLWAEASVD